MDSTAALKRPGLVTLLAVAQFAGAGCWLLIAVGLGLGTALGGATAPPAMAVVVLLPAGPAVVQVACGVGPLKLRPYGRTLQLVLAFMRSFATNTGADVWQSTTSTAPAEPFGPPAIRLDRGPGARD